MTCVLFSFSINLKYKLCKNINYLTNTFYNDQVNNNSIMMTRVMHYNIYLHFYVGNQ